MATKAAGNFAGRVSRVLRDHVGDAVGASTRRVDQEGLVIQADTSTACWVSARYASGAFAVAKAADAARELKRAGFTVKTTGKTTMWVSRGADLPDGWKKRKSILPGVVNWENSWYPGWSVERRPDSTIYYVRRMRTEDVPFEELQQAIAYIVENGGRKS